MKITIPGELTDLNKYTKANRANKFAGSKVKKENTELVAWHAKKHRNHDLKYPVDFEFKWYVPNKRKDKDNIVFAKKFILDGLVEAGVLPDDNWKHVGDWTEKVRVDKENPRVEIEII